MVGAGRLVVNRLAVRVNDGVSLVVECRLAVFEPLKDNIHRVLKRFFLFANLHRIDELHKRVHVAFVLRRFVVDQTHEGAVQQCFGL
jgi:hypothetical protein